MQTDPGHKGNTATNALKPATLETGLEVQVPLFQVVFRMFSPDFLGDIEGSQNYRDLSISNEVWRRVEDPNKVNVVRGSN